MSLKHIDMESAIRRVADRRIEEAMKEGKFDNLPGYGKDIELEPIPAEENSRLMWWAIRILRQNDVIPDEIRLRKEIENLKESLPDARSARERLALIRQINALVKRLNTLGTNALPTSISPIDESSSESTGPADPRAGGA
jgi:hypothetical protein